MLEDVTVTKTPMCARDGFGRRNVEGNPNRLRRLFDANPSAQNARINIFE